MSSHSVYQLMPSEYHKYRTHLLMLDRESRYTRFGYYVSDYTIGQLCDQVESNCNAHKIFAIEDDDLNLLAVGHISLEGGETELAFSVLTPYRKQGMGSALMSRCIEWCQNRNIKRGSMVCLSTNTAIKRLASKYGILVNENGETMADIKIPELSLGSVVHEVVDSNLARIDHLSKFNRKLAHIFGFPVKFK